MEQYRRRQLCIPKNSNEWKNCPLPRRLKTCVFSSFLRTQSLCLANPIFSKCNRNLTTWCFDLLYRWVSGRIATPLLVLFTPLPSLIPSFTLETITCITLCNVLIYFNPVYSGTTVNGIAWTSSVYKMRCWFTKSIRRTPVFPSGTSWTEKSVIVGRCRGRAACRGCSLAEGAARRQSRNARVLWRNCRSTRPSALTMTPHRPLSRRPPLRPLHQWYRFTTLVQEPFLL